MADVTCGTLVIVNADGSPIAHTQDATLDVNRELPDATTKDSGGWEEFLEACGNSSAEGTVDGLASFGTGGNVETIMQSIIDKETIEVIYGPDTSGSVQISGQAAFSNVSLGSPDGEAATLSADWKFNGAPNLTTAS